MMSKMCGDWLTATICTFVAAAAVQWVLSWLYPTCIAVGGIVTLIAYWKKDLSAKVSP
jgi:hypothetical protein